MLLCKELEDISEINLSISEEERKLNDLYMQLGKKYVEKIKGVICCENCGAEISEKSGFCSNCGTKVEKEGNAEVEEDMK